MMKWLCHIIVVFLFLFPILLVAQEETPERSPEPADATPVEEPAEEEKPVNRNPANAAAAVKEWTGEVLLKITGSDAFDILAPTGEEKAHLFFGDTIRTSEGASIIIILNDGSIVELGPQSELVLEQTSDGKFSVRLQYGICDVTIESDNFEFVCARHKITGANSRVIVKSPDIDNIDIFGIENGATVVNEFGLITYLGKGQKIESIYTEETGLFTVTVHEYNEIGLKIEVTGEGRMFDPGTRFTVDSNLNIEILGTIEEVAEPLDEIAPIPMEFDVAKDEPFEDAGDIQSINKITPHKP